MKSLKQISVPNPCQQSWHQMTDVSNGRHCSNCAKTVIDFTKMKDEQIIAYLNDQHHVCARFYDGQLDQINRKIDPDSLAKPSLKKWSATLGLLCSLLLMKAEAQLKVSGIPGTEQSDTNKVNAQSFTLGKVLLPDSGMYRVITGCVSDDQNIPMNGVSVSLPDVYKGVQTGVNGNFKLRVPLSAKHILIRYIGYHSQLVDITDESVYNVKFQEQPMFLGEVAVIRRYSLPKRIWKKIKRMF